MKADNSSKCFTHAYLVVCNGREKGNIYNINNRITNIGRDESVNIYLNYNWIASHFHAAIISENGKYYIVHLRSAMCTSVNGDLIEHGSIELKDNDVIELGKTKLKFKRCHMG